VPRAAVCVALGAPLRVMDLTVGAPRAGEIKVRLGASGLCASDLAVQHGHLPSPLPIVLGHEGAGVVTEVGPDVTGLVAGDHVVVTAMPQCGECYRCGRGQPSLCDVGATVLDSGALRDGTARFTAADGRDVWQMVAAGTFAEEVVVSAISAVRIPCDVGFVPASLIGCGVVTGAGAALNATSIGPGQTVAVLGCGVVGLSAIQGARIAGAEQIVAVDLIAAKLELALRVGATDAVDAGPDAVAAVRALTGGRGVDVCIEAVGAQVTVDQAIAMTDRGGEVVFVGAGAPEVRVNVRQFTGLVGRAKTFRGVLFGSADIQRDVALVVEHYRTGAFVLDALVTGTFGLGEINDGLAALAGGEVVAGVVQFA
jgi:Zn-dependent alcohol dehydrogenase